MSFLNAYSSYNQILIAKYDKMKTTFIIKEANDCYEVTPLALKNSRATYQRLIDRVFSHLIGKNIEVYIEDITVKSPTPTKHYQDLFKVFSVLDTYNL